MKKIIKKIQKLLENELVERIVITFVEGFLTVILAAELKFITTVSDVKTLMVAAISMGMSAVWNLVLKPLIFDIRTKLRDKLNKLNK